MATLKQTKNWFSRLTIAYCRSNVLRNAPLEHSAKLLTFIKLPFVIKIFLSIFDWPFYTGCTVCDELFLVCFVAKLLCVDVLCPSQPFFSHVGTFPVCFDSLCPSQQF